MLCVVTTPTCAVGPRLLNVSNHVPLPLLPAACSQELDEAHSRHMQRVQCLQNEVRAAEQRRQQQDRVIADLRHQLAQAQAAPTAIAAAAATAPPSLSPPAAAPPPPAAAPQQGCAEVAARALEEEAELLGCCPEPTPGAA